MVLLDTHVWLWWLIGDGALRAMERNRLDELASRQRLAISWASVWEAEILEAKGRIQLLPDFESWIRIATDQSVCRVIPVDMDLVIAQRKLPPAFHQDPADRLITATAMLAGWPLATHDQRIRNSATAEIWVAK
ncbi:MAG: PIN domain-containing protein [Balneolaceae bacterium]|nr:MAG: PIN domain-containing protein [Balneolaceae bacterium]